MLRTCFLRCLQDSHAPIKLVHNVETVIGRSKSTKITDPACSRMQLSLKADCVTCLVHVKQLGVNASGLDGCALVKEIVYKVEHGSRIELLLNNYIHTIEFNPPPETNRQIGHKRKLEEEHDSPRKRKLIKTVASTELLEIIKPAIEDQWEDIDKGELYVFTSKGVKSSAKIAAFDMDGTLISTKSGKVFPVDINDWKIAFPSVEKKLKELIGTGHKVVIMSNQASIGNGRIKIDNFKKKMEAIVKQLDVPIQAYIATGKGFYRKPLPGMWKVLSEQKNDGLCIDMKDSFFCGDAAGRLPNWAPGKKKDHSMADKLMAENLGLRFFTPEQFFLGHSTANIPMAKPVFNPKDLSSGDFNHNLVSKGKEVLVLVGFPGSGKSFLAKQIEMKSQYAYATVCRDSLGSWQKCASQATKLLQEGKSVVIDCTNPDKESRARWITLAKEMKVDCRCVKMTASMEHARHNNKFRELAKFDHLSVNDIVYHTYKNKFVEPSTTEGFKEIINVNFNPCFENEEFEKLYKMYLLEK